MDYGYGGSYYGGNYYGGRKKRSGILIFVLLLVVAVIIFSLIKGLGGRHRAIAGIREPIQKETTGHVDTKVAGYDVHIEYKYSYDIEALVVSTKNYSGSGVGDKLSPKDVALAWGKVAEYNKKIDFNWRQSGRWVNWSVSNTDVLEPVGGIEGVGKQCSNNHLIPADTRAKKAIKKIKKGDHIRIQGYLVYIDGKKSDGSTFYWNSSTSRDDDGDGACEVIYVTSVEWLK